MAVLVYDAEREVWDGIQFLDHYGLRLLRVSVAVWLEDGTENMHVLNGRGSGVSGRMPLISRIQVGFLARTAVRISSPIGGATGDGRIAR